MVWERVPPLRRLVSDSRHNTRWQSFFFGRTREEKFDSTPGFRIAVITLALTLAGYFAIYVITPYDLYWHLRFSLNRLFLQLWPSVIFLFFLKVFHSREEICTL